MTKDSRDRDVASAPDGGGASSSAATPAEGVSVPHAHTQMQDKLMRRKVETTPMGQSLTFDTSRLPSAPAPSLDNLTVLVPLPAPFAEEELMERFYQRCYENAPAIAREEGELIGPNDRVWVDIVGYAGGRILPFSIREDLELLIGVDTFLEGFNQLLVGYPVGESVTLQVVLPDDYPAVALRDTTAAFAIDLKRAEALTLPDPDNPEEIAILGYGKDLEGILGSLVKEIYAERTEELLNQAEQEVLQKLTQRVYVEVPEDLIDEEIRRNWLQHEGLFLAQREFPAHEQQEALNLWLHDPNLRLDTAQRLKAALVLRAIAERDHLTVEPSEVDHFVEEVAEALNLPSDELRASLAHDDQARDQIVSHYIHMRAVEHVMQHATLHFEGADEHV